MNTHRTGVRATKRSIALLAATAVAGGLFVLAPTTSAHAAPVCADPTRPIDSSRQAGGAVKLGTTKTRKLNLTVYTHEGCTVTGARARVQSPSGVKTVTLRKTKVRGGVVTWEGQLAVSPKKLRNSDAGGWPTAITVTGAKTQRITVQSQVLRASRLTFNAGPEPVRKGKLTYSGKLVRASWNSDRYVAYGKQSIEIRHSFDDDAPEIVATPTTKANGRFRVTRAYTGAGDYQAAFEGSSTTYTSLSKVDRIG